MAAGAWMDRALCLKHPILTPDAWGKFKGQAPVDEGAEAWVVCMFACPVRADCAEKFSGIDIVAGGGWFTKSGKRVMPDPEYMDVNRAAAYLGVTTAQIRQSARTRLASVKINGRTHFLIDDIIELGKNPRYGPPHGTYRARRVHTLRGEGWCSKCIQLTAEVLRLEPVA